MLLNTILSRTPKLLNVSFIVPGNLKSVFIFAYSLYLPLFLNSFMFMDGGDHLQSAASLVRQSDTENLYSALIHIYLYQMSC